MNQCWNILNLTLRNKLQWNLNRNSDILIKKNIRKCRLRNGGHYVLASMCQELQILEAMQRQHADVANLSNSNQLGVNTNTPHTLRLHRMTNYYSNFAPHPHPRPTLLFSQLSIGRTENRKPRNSCHRCGKTNHTHSNKCNPYLHH